MGGAEGQRIGKPMRIEVDHNDTCGGVQLCGKEGAESNRTATDDSNSGARLDLSILLDTVNTMHARRNEETHESTTLETSR